MGQILNHQKCYGISSVRMKNIEKPLKKKTVNLRLIPKISIFFFLKASISLVASATGAAISYTGNKAIGLLGISEGAAGMKKRQTKLGSIHQKQINLRSSFYTVTFGMTIFYRLRSFVFSKHQTTVQLSVQAKTLPKLTRDSTQATLLHDAIVFHEKNHLTI